MRVFRRSAVPSLVVLGLAACTGDSAPSTERVERGGAITIIERTEMGRPMPLIAETALDAELSDVMYLPLLTPRWEAGELRFLDAGQSPTAIARSYELFGPDSASLRYRLRSDLVWSDGTPLTARDAAWTLETQGNPAAASPRLDFSAQIRSVEVEDDTTLVVHFARRYPEMLFHTAGAVAPRHVFEPSDPAQLRTHPSVTSPEGGNLVVSGPYLISAWERGQRVVLAPNPRFRPEPNIQRVVLLTIPEETTRMIELQTGRVDVMEVPLDKVDLVRRGTSGIRLERRERRFYDYIAYNPRSHPALADRDVRRALGLALDLDQIVQGLRLGEFGEPAAGPYAPIFRELHDPQRVAPLPHDTAEAMRLLDAAGWRPGRDGIRVQDGRPLRFTLLINAGNQRRADAAQIVQQQWRRVGVDARLQVLESGAFFEQLFGREYEAAIAGWGVALAPDISDQWRGDGPFNHTSYANAEVGRLFDLALAQPTEELAAPLWRQAAELIVADQPYTWLYYFDQVMAVSERLRATRIDALGTYQSLQDWWVSSGAEAPSADPFAR